MEMTPQSHNRNFQRTIVPDEASCKTVTTFLVAEYVKSKMTRECNLGQVGFNDKGYKDAANLPVKQFQEKDSP